MRCPVQPQSVPFLTGETTPGLGALIASLCVGIFSYVLNVVLTWTRSRASVSF